MGAARRIWDAAKHPRGYHGRFGTGEGTKVVTRVKGRVESTPEWQVRKREIARAGANLASSADRVDSPIRGPREAKGHWFIPANAGGTRWWVPQQKKPTIIGGYLYKPGFSRPYSTAERPGMLDEHGRPHAPLGTALSSPVPDATLRAMNFHKQDYHRARMATRRKSKLLGRVIGADEDVTKGVATHTVQPRRHQRAAVARLAARATSR